MKLPTIQLGPVSRISIGLISLVIAIILIADSALNILPNERKQQIALRQHIAQAIGSQVVVLLSTEDTSKLNFVLNHMAENNDEIISIGLRRMDGNLSASSNKHLQAWVASPTKTSTPTHVIMPLTIGETSWGQIEVTFHELGPRGFKDWVHNASISLTLLLLTVGFIAFYLYLKRALQYLDPSQAVPERVRKAFDTLKESVVILDAQGRIMLANAGFYQLHPHAGDNLDGKYISQLKWLSLNMPRDEITNKFPWESVIQTNQPLHGKELQIELPSGDFRELIMNCSAIGDDTGNVRGCLISFDDITELGRAKTLLQQTVQELQMSKDKIEQQNEELQKIAFYDPLTACLNRRAFFDKAQPLYKDTFDKNNAVCIMSDIDHFKSFNDRYGHSVGDLVIQQVARTLGRTLRLKDLLCRYGGEEFCIFLVGFTIDDGLAIAERMRSGVEKEAGPGIRSVPNLKITSSFGVASIKAGNKTLEELIDQADQALYKAKKAGRNRVIAYDYTKDDIVEEPPKGEAVHGSSH